MSPETFFLLCGLHLFMDYKRNCYHIEFINCHPVRLACQLPANSTFLSEQTSHQPAVLFSQNKSAPTISHQPNEQAVLCQII
jgi:hypothetical protein